jgi:predicted RNA polymerase sigma factor
VTAIAMRSALVHATSDRLYAIATRILRDGDLAEDALHGALVTACRQSPKSTGAETSGSSGRRPR